MNTTTATAPLPGTHFRATTGALKRPRPRTLLNPRPLRRVVQLKVGDLLQIVDGAGTWVVASSGLVWTTEEGSLADTVMHAGYRHRIQNQGMTLLLAYRTARVELEVPASVAVPRAVFVASATGRAPRSIPLRRRTPLPMLLAEIAKFARKVRAAWQRSSMNKNPSLLPYPSVYY